MSGGAVGWLGHVSLGLFGVGTAATTFGEGAPAVDDALHSAAAAVRETCYSCHGADKAKGSLRLDGVEGWLGQVDLGSPEDSELLYRMTLPVDDPDAMPPEGERLDPASIAAIQSWIEAGADAESLRNGLEYAEGAATRRAARMEAIRQATGARIENVRGAEAAPGEPPPLSVTWSHRRAVPTGERLAALADIAGEVLELGLAGTEVTDAALASLPELPALERVHLERTSISDAGVRSLLERAPGLRYLNLYGTLVTADVRETLRHAEHLGEAILFGTAAEVGGLRAPFSGVPAREPRRILAADASKKRVALFRETAIGHPKLLWEGRTSGLHDLQWLGDTEGGHGRVLFQENWTRVVEVDTASGEVLWSYDAQGPTDVEGPVEIHSFRRLDDGTTMVAESGRSRIVFVDTKGEITDSFPLQVSKADAHRDTRLVRPTPSGTFLVAHEGDGVIREYTREGKAVWSFDVPLFGKPRAGGHGFDAHGNQAFGAIRLRGGDTLISTGNGHSFLRVNPAGEIVWDLTQDELEGVRFAWTTCVQELRNGNLILGNCHGGKGQPQAVEVTPKGQLEWSFRDFERFGNGLSNLVVIESTPVPRPDVAVIGPVIGTLTETSVRLWGRALGDQEVAIPYSVKLGELEVASGQLLAAPERDYTVEVPVEGLQPGRLYSVALGAGSGSFRTLAPAEQITGARLAFGSCASHDRFESQPIWTAIQRMEPEALVLLGDTPYIDSTKLAHQRQRYAEFWQIPELRPLAASVPVTSTWDDHDFATNDQVGAQPGRENSRQAFLEYHPQSDVGDGSRGVYSKFRRGPVEVFVLDTRWFGDEEALGEDPEVPSLLGKTQREWLIDGVTGSTAEIKVLACGMVWNGAVRPGKRDHWGTWSAERDAIFAALGTAGVEGVVLVGGDIHRPRVIRHVGAEAALGYAPIELISSPLANHHIATAAAPHEGLLWDAKANFVALILDVTGATGGEPVKVEATFIGPKGETLHRQVFAPTDLARSPGGR